MTQRLCSLHPTEASRAEDPPLLPQVTDAEMWPLRSFLKLNPNHKSEGGISQRVASPSPWRRLIACWDTADGASIRAMSRFWLSKLRR